MGVTRSETPQLPAEVEYVSIEPPVLSRARQIPLRRAVQCLS
jgi:hypothetical protein